MPKFLRAMSCMYSKVTALATTNTLLINSENSESSCFWDNTFFNMINQFWVGIFWVTSVKSPKHQFTEWISYWQYSAIPGLGTHDRSRLWSKRCHYLSQDFKVVPNRDERESEKKTKGSPKFCHQGWQRVFQLFSFDPSVAWNSPKIKLVVRWLKYLFSE